MEEKQRANDQVQKNQEQQGEKNKIIKKTADYVRRTLEGESSGHDWWHAYRVWGLAKTIAQKEGADFFVVELAALLHDIADWKFHDGDETVGPRVARKWLESLHVEKKVIDHICQIMKDMSFKGTDVATPMKTLEGKIVQDADRLDAIGAIGVARCFAYGGNKGFSMHNPQEKSVAHKTADDYKKNSSTSLNHFYEKLFLVKDRINTQTARLLAQERHDFMKKFVNKFLNEWNGSAK